MEELNDLILQRRKKLAELREAGMDPFEARFDPQTTTAAVREVSNSIGKDELEAEHRFASVAGRIVAMRDFGKAAFAHLQDGSGRLQLYFRKDILGERYSQVKKLDIGDIIGVSGRVFRTKTDELTLEISDFTLVCKALLPLPEKWHGLKDVELRYRQRYVDLIVNPHVKETFAKRSAIIKAVRDFLESKDFIEVETPMMHQIPGGAAARPFVTHHNALDTDLFLRIAPELYLKRLLVGGYERIFELNKNFRNEGISIKHNPEFTMLEFYMAYKDYRFLMDFTEELFSAVANKVLGTLKVPYGEDVIDLTPPWPRIPMLESLRQKGVPDEVMQDRNFALRWAWEKKLEVKKEASHAKIIDEIFKEFVEQYLVQPTFIIDYPVELSPLAKRKPEAPELVERFELFIAAREIANAFSELNDPIDQRQRFEKQVFEKQQGDDEAHEMDEDFVRSLEYGMPPAAGEGIGLDRLVMLLTNSPSIRDVILFPQLKPEQC
ncbi:MAG TPA: lysine--tRNA ligase [Dissulfurispiraceae bacterium]|nr:lysine--tRNA ligase [Dissulfurispiraceae bacterium]